MGIEQFNLITDRTQADVERVSYLMQKGFANMTDAERTEYLGGAKGAYNASDLNRVGEAMQYLADRLTENGYSFSLNVKTDWAINDIPTSAQLDQYLSNMRTLRGVITLSDDTANVPASMNRFNYVQANAIEQILETIDALLDNIVAAFKYSGELYSGEV